MKRKELEAMGLEKEQVDQIMTQNGADIEAAKKELQDQVTTLTTEKEELQGQLNTANETLKGFKDVDVNDLRGQIDKLTNDLDQAKKDADARVADLTFQQTLKDAIVAAKGRSTKAIMAELDLDTLGDNDFVYCDPPYLITVASYNENGGWGEQAEIDLLAKLDALDKAGVKFGLSNVFESKGKENTILKEWAKGYTVHYLDHTYSNCSYHKKDKQSKDIEVFITNY